jgi:hypothetical protein
LFGTGGVFRAALARAADWRLATFAADGGHVFAVAADRLAPCPRAARFFRIEFVRRAFLVGGLSAFAGDGALCGFIHGGKAALDVPLGLSFAVLTI